MHSPVERHNANVPVGHWRTIDLQTAPFNIRTDARFDYPVGTEWRKRALLLVNPWYRRHARRLDGSALALASEYRP